MKHSSKTSRTGKRSEREGLMLRIDPALAKWWQDAADRGAGSRNALLERVLSAFKTALEAAETDQDGETGWKGFGWTLALEAIGMGLAGPVLRQTLAIERENDLGLLQHAADDNRQQLAASRGTEGPERIGELEERMKEFESAIQALRSEVSALRKSGRKAGDL